MKGNNKDLNEINNDVINKLKSGEIPLYILDETEKEKIYEYLTRRISIKKELLQDKKNEIIYDKIKKNKTNKKSILEKLSDEDKISLLKYLKKNY